MNSVNIVIGVGGTGINLALEISECFGKSRKNYTPLILALDTVRSFRNAPNDNFYFLGGFDLELAISSIDYSSWKYSEIDRIRQIRNSNISYGAMALPEIGRLALTVHRKALIQWLSESIQKIIHNKIENVEILVVGTQAGGTGAGIIPELGRILQNIIKSLHKRGWIVGLCLNSKYFEKLFATRTIQFHRDNQIRSLRWLKNEFIKDKYLNEISYNSFYISEANDDTSIVESIHKVAEIVTQRWVTQHDASIPLSLENNENDGTLLFNIFDETSPDLQVLWSEDTQIVNLTAGKVDESYGLFFQVPRIYSRWADMIKDFRNLISSPNVTEGQIQKFFENNPNFLTGIEYQRAVPQVHLQGYDEKAIIPDFMLVPFDDTFADIIELKHPHHKLLVNEGKYPRFSATVAGALTQLKTYKEYFDNEENRKKLLDKYGFTSYKPKLSLVIGRSSTISSHLLFRKVTAEFPQISVYTYDDIASKTERLMDNLFK